MLNLTKKKIQYHLDNNSNDPDSSPLINIQKIQNLIEKSLSKKKFSSISSKIELINEIINFLIYISLTFNNFQTNPNFAPNSLHLLHPNSLGNYEEMIKELNLSEKEIKDELDSLNHKKVDLDNNDGKMKQEDKNREIESLQIKINQLLILLGNLNRLREIKLEIKK